MARFNWTPKRKIALECLLSAGGNARVAAELSKQFTPSVSEGYLRALKYDPRYKPFREEYHRRTGEILNALEVDESYVLETLLELSRPGMKPNVRLGAAKALGDYLGMWAPQRIETAQKIEEIILRWPEEEIIGAVKEVIEDARTKAGGFNVK